MIEPNFVIAGAQRSGTTAAYHLLDQHPQIYMAKPVTPEPKFFIREPAEGCGREWYLQTYFSDAKDVLVAGEKSTSYIEVPGTARRMKAMFPGMKVVFVLRHPVERAISNYRLSVQYGMETEPLDRAMRMERFRLEKNDFPEISVHPFAYLRRGCYAMHLESYLEFFSEEAVKIIFNDDLQEDPAKVCRELFDFLGVDPGVSSPSPQLRCNPHVRDDLRVSRATLKYLLDFFVEPNRRLARLLNHDLSHWDRPSPMIEAMVA